MSSLSTRIRSFLKQEGRSGKLKRNIVGFFGVKGATMLIELFKVPVMLEYLDTSKYGVWLTLVSIVLWVNNFDIGLSAGLRYKLAEAFARNDTDRARRLVSTAYVSLSTIMFCAGFVLLPLIFIVDWNEFLNVKDITLFELRISLAAILLCFLVQFVLELLGAILKADQRSAISEIFKPIGSAVSLIIVLILSFFGDNSLFLASIAMSLPYLFIIAAATFRFFGKDYRSISPSLSFYTSSMLTDIYSIGVKFFISSISTLVVFTSANVILSNKLGPEAVSIYSTAKTYYGLTIVFLNVIVISSCAPITEAFTKDDFAWIRKTMKATMFVSMLFTIGEIIMLAASPFVFHLWIGDKLIIPWIISISLAIYQILALYAQPYNYFLAGTGKLTVNTIVSVGKIILFYPIAFWFIARYGTVGLIIATILVNTLPNLIVGQLQYSLLLSGRAKGIWNK